MCQAQAARPSASPENSGNFQVTALPIVQAGGAVIANKNGEISDDRSAILSQQKPAQRVVYLPLRATKRVPVERHPPLSAQLRLIKSPITSPAPPPHNYPPPPPPSSS